MKKSKNQVRRLLAFGDVHFPQQNPEALAVFKRVVESVNPDLVVCLGDLLDCKAFSTHAPDGSTDTPFQHELDLANSLFDFLQKHSRQLVMLEGNHEYRIARYAARDRAGKAALSLLSPQANLSRGRKNFTYIPYAGKHGTYAHYAVTSNLRAVHGWSYAAHATKEHLAKAQGRSIIHGHTHRADHHLIQDVWEPGLVVEAIAAGCLCDLVPTYGAGQPVTWVNGFVQGFIGPKDHTLYFIPIVAGRCVMPDGKEIKA